MSKFVSIVLIVIVIAALAMFGTGLADALHACSRKHWIGCDWGQVESLGVWLIPVAAVIVIAIVRLLTRRGK